MNKILLIAFVVFASCKEKTQTKDTLENATPVVKTVVTESYELVTVNDSKALLIVFPGGGETSLETKESFKIVEAATAKNISVLLMNFNRHLWIEAEDSEKLSAEINGIIQQHDLTNNKISWAECLLGELWP